MSSHPYSSLDSAAELSSPGALTAGSSQDASSVKKGTYPPSILPTVVPEKEKVSLSQRGILRTFQGWTVTRRFAKIYWSLSSLLGFQERWSFFFWFIAAGGYIGFSLARTILLSPSKFRSELVPGEYYWYRKSLYKPNLIIHIYLGIITGIFVIFQFVPAIRRRSIFLHRLNGYLSLGLLIPSLITGAILGRRSFGGDISIQGLWYISGALSIAALLIGYSYVKRDTRRHREWMMRGVTYNGIVVTARILSLLTRRILKDSDAAYYTVWSCAQISFVEGTHRDFASRWPTCVGLSEEEGEGVQVPVLAHSGMGKVHSGSQSRISNGFALWTAFFLHAVLVEVYINWSKCANKFRVGYVLQREKMNKDETN
ncbi:hypothetical protein BT69DRAFT_1328884 [Atractiella rhizophila]|nr:hypothetical protein BT69DRAFT_1328884 [Atractiella rhizophila]